MTRFVTQLEPLISLSDHRASSHAREHEDRERRTLLRKPITSVPLTGTGNKLQTGSPFKTWITTIFRTDVGLERQRNRMKLTTPSHSKGLMSSMTDSIDTN